MDPSSIWNYSQTLDLDHLISLSFTSSLLRRCSTVTGASTENNLEVSVGTPWPEEHLKVRQSSIVKDSGIMKIKRFERSVDETSQNNANTLPES